MRANWLKLLAGVSLVGLVPAGCGGSESTIASAGAAASPRASVHSQASEGAVASEAQAAATGDIPDNQVFLTYDDPAAGYAIRYPEGWTRRGSGTSVVFRDKANVIRVFVVAGAPPSVVEARAGIARLKRSDPSVRGSAARRLTIGGAPVVKLTYTRLSSPDSVTGKRLPLTIDRYEYAHAGKVAIVDLGTPVGVDNVDAYRMIGETFRWR